MRKFLLPAIVLCGLSVVSGATVGASEPQIGNVTLTTSDGKSAGMATLTQTPHGVLITADLKNLTIGEHAFHIHETGACEPDFSAAGGHFAPEGRQHGFVNPEGHHAGDLPSIFAASDGTAKVHIFTTRITLGDGPNSILDEDGSTLVIHADSDSYLKDPLAGEPVACGVITK